MARRKRTYRRRKTGRRNVAFILVLLGVGMLTHGCYIQRALQREIAQAPRDPVTGVITGQEALTLSPSPSAPVRHATACLLIHGFGGGRGDFNALGRRLAGEGHTVRLMRLPGHGTTPVDLAHQPPDAWLDAVREEHRQLTQRHEAVHVVGFSLGGALAVRLADETAIDRLALIAPCLAVRQKWYYLLPLETWNGLLCPMVPYVIKSKGFVNVNDREQAEHIFSYRATSSAAVGRLFRTARLARDPETLARITCPTLVIYSEQDDVACPRAIEKAFEQLGAHDKQLLPLTRSNHLILWDYDRELAVDTLLHFLRG